MKILSAIACTAVFSMLIFANRKYLLPLESDSDNKWDGIKDEAESSDDKLKEDFSLPVLKYNEAQND